MPQLVLSCDIEAPIAEVWAFHERDDALDLLSPPGTTKLDRRDPGLDVGVEVQISVRLFPGLWWPWLARHTVCEPLVRFVDEQISGPFRSWRHEHRFEAIDEDRTRLTDHLTWRSWWWQFPPAADLLTRHRLIRVFRYRHRVTKQACEPVRPVDAGLA